MKSTYFSEETKQKIFQIVQAVFRVTNLFPYGEALRFELRKEAAEVLRESARYSVISIAPDDILSFAGKIRGLRSLLFLARSNRFVNPVNCEVLERECRFLEDFFMKASEVEVLGDFISPSKTHEGLAKASSKLPASYEQHKDYRHNDTQRTARIQKRVSPLNSGEAKDRKGTIIEFLQKKDKSSIKDIADVFNDVSTKTIQRDLNSLIQDGRVERSGDKRWALYHLKNE